MMPAKMIFQNINIFLTLGKIGDTAITIYAIRQKICRKSIKISTANSWTIIPTAKLKVIEELMAMKF